MNLFDLMTKAHSANTPYTKTLQRKFKNCKIKDRNRATRIARSIPTTTKTPLAVNFTKTKLIYNSGFIWEVRSYHTLTALESMPYKISWILAKDGSPYSQWTAPSNQPPALQRLQNLNSSEQLYTPKISDILKPVNFVKKGDPHLVILKQLVANYKDKAKLKGLDLSFSDFDEIKGNSLNSIAKGYRVYRCNYGAKLINGLFSYKYIAISNDGSNKITSESSIQFIGNLMNKVEFKVASTASAQALIQSLNELHRDTSPIKVAKISDFEYHSVSSKGKTIFKIYLDKNLKFRTLKPAKTEK